MTGLTIDTAMTTARSMRVLGAAIEGLPEPVTVRFGGGEVEVTVLHPDQFEAWSDRMTSRMRCIGGIEGAIADVPVRLLLAGAGDVFAAEAVA